MTPLRVVVFHSMTINTGFRCVAEGPQSPDQVPISGWPSWAAAPAIIVSVASVTHAHKQTEQDPLARTLASTLYGAIRLLRSSFLLSAPIIRIGARLPSWQTNSNCSAPGAHRKNMPVVHGAV